MIPEGNPNVPVPPDRCCLSGDALRFIGVASAHRNRVPYVAHKRLPDMVRFSCFENLLCQVESFWRAVHMYSLDEGENAEAALAVELPPDHRTKIVLARCLQRQGALGKGESLQTAWSTTLANLQGRAAPFLPVPLVPPVGRGGGRGGRGRGRGRGR